MKTVTILMAFIAISLNVSAQNEKVLVKTIVTNDIDKVSIEMDGEVKVETWKEDYARVLIHIEHHNAHPNLLKVLITKGRYNISTVTEEGLLTLSCEEVKESLVFGNNETTLDETISYTIYLPENIQIQQKSTKQLAANEK